MKLSRYYQRFEDASQKIEEAQEMLKNIDGTKKECVDANGKKIDNYKLIDLACTMITEFEQIKKSYVKLALIEDGTLKPLMTKKEVSKMDKLWDKLAKFDFIGKGYKAIKTKTYEGGL